MAIDAAGAGGARPYTYAVPDRLADLEDGEAVLVEFGRRQALGVILGPADGGGVAGTDVKPIIERVRADGPLLPPLTLWLARWIAATTSRRRRSSIRSMLPPGLLERLELVAELTPVRQRVRAGIDDPVDVDLLDQLAHGSAAGAGARRARRAGRAAAPPAVAGRPGRDRAGLDAARRLGGPAVRALAAR